MCFANLPVSTQSPVIKYSVSNKFSLVFYRFDLFLQISEKAPGVCTIHLCVMKFVNIRFASSENRTIFSLWAATVTLPLRSPVQTTSISIIENCFFI